MSCALLFTFIRARYLISSLKEWNKLASSSVKSGLMGGGGWLHTPSMCLHERSEPTVEESRGKDEITTCACLCSESVCVCACV